LAVADKPDSHDICFIADGDTRGFLERRLGGASAGEIVDAESGEVLGTHQGSFGFTVGQRRGLHLDRPAAGGEPRYVVEVQAGPHRLVSLLTAEAVRELKLAPGVQVIAVVKATNVMIDLPS